RQDLIDRAANDYQRGRLTSALGAQMELTRDGMARHVAEQSLAWQRQVAQDRIALLTKEAGLHHDDDALIDTLGHAAATAARAHARVGTGLPGGEPEDTAAATARSGVLGAAIQARLDRGDTDGAKVLLAKVGDQLDPAHATPINEQIAQAEQPATLPDGPYYFDAIPGTGGMEPEEETPPSAGGVEPPPGSPEYQAAQAEAEALENKDPSPAPATQAIDIALPGLGELAGETAWGRLGGWAARVIPYAGRVATGAAGAATLLLPENTQATFTELPGGLRLRTAPGQRTVTIERKTDNGILGTGIGAKWEELPVNAEHTTAPDGRSMIAIDPRQLERAIGAEAMSRIGRSSGIAMARPPRDRNGEKRPTPGIGHNSGNDPDPDDGQKPPPPIDREAAAQTRKTAEDALLAGIFGKRSDPERERRETRQAAEEIAAHAYEKHKNEFADVHSPQQFVDHIENAMSNATDSESNGHGRTVYWHAPSGTFVARNRDNLDPGTAMKPTNGRAYYETERRKMVKEIQQKR
ncbi:MAG: hypothetical protein JSR24_08235, partial [Proteobacteria bacterium]|nr:hypothetical protein [Pseudomonadota bacterium]